MRIPCAAEARETLIAELHEAGTTGVLEEDAHLVAWFDHWDTAARFGHVEAAPEQDWSTAWQQFWTPRLVGERFFLVPAWTDEPTPEGRIRMDYLPGMACGTGEHPGTRLAMMGLEAMVRPGDQVLDIGCGSGILCRAAQLLGGRAIGCDIEAADLAVAREHVDASYFVGSADAVRSQSADVVTANINAEVLVALSTDLRRIARRAIVLSGFRPESIPELEATYGPARRLSLEGWSALVV
ncbi:MAG: 50S ribosomal protein L11 methyltransferase [Bryobacteraceae bacterium]|nr:50S ribosomal protein L11 methyltransferase [Bryobacteraceae bacterium]